MSTRRTPFDEMDRMFDQMRRSMRSPWSGRFDDGDLPEMDRWMDARESNMSVERDGEDYVVLADLPGFEKEELDLRFEDGLLTVRGRHETSEASETGSSTRSRSVFERVSLPGDVVEDAITATYRNGVLEVRLPAVDPAPEDDSHRIDID
jgi:HSP20 family protein